MNMKIQNKSYISFIDTMFYFFYTLMVLVKGFGFYEGQWPFDLGLIIACSFFVLYFLSSHNSLASFVISLMLLIIGILTVVYSGEFGALLNLMVLIGMNSISERKIIRLSAFLWTIVFTVQTLITCSGIRENQVFRIHRKLGHYVIRWSMGFTHPNVFHISYFIIICLLMLAIRPHGKKLVKFSVFAFIGNLLVFLYSYSFTGLLIVTFYLIINSYIQHRKKRLLLVERVLLIVFTPLCILFSVIGPIIIKGNLYEIINKALSTRFSLSRYYLTTQKIGLFGTKIFDVPDASYTIDSSYVYALVHYGIVYFTLFCVLLVFCAYYLLKKHRYFEFAILISCSFAGITEQFLTNTSFKSIVFIFFGVMLYSLIDNCIMLPKRKCCLLAKRTWHIFTAGNCHIVDYSVVLSTYLKRIIHVTKCKRKQILCISLCGFIVGCLMYTFSVDKPKIIYASPWDCDIKEGKEATQYTYYNDIKDDPDVWVLSNRDSAGKLYSFSGYTIDFEYLRRAIGAGYSIELVFSCIAIILYVMWCRDDRRKL